MKVRDLKALISDASDDDDVAIMNTYDGEVHTIDDVSLSHMTVYIEADIDIHS